MSRHLHFDPIGGLAGDMILGALTELAGTDGSLRALPERLGLAGVQVEIAPATRHGIGARRVHVRVESETAHRHLADMRRIVSTAGLPPAVSEAALAVFARLAEAEADVHRSEPEKVHFHEVGGDDALVDIVGSCQLLHELDVERITCGPLPVCPGLTTGAHGGIPLPAPAVLALAPGWPLVWVDGDEELVTPTGAALVTTLARPERPAAGRLIGAGYGAGGRDSARRPNLLRVLLLDAETEAAPADERVDELVAAMDDATGEQLARAAEILLGAGALDAYHAPLVMKKGRPGWQLTVLSPPHRTETLTGLIMRHTSTAGVRRRELWRSVMDRKRITVQTPHGAIRVNVFTDAAGGEKAAPEYEDCRAAAVRDDVSLSAVQQSALDAYVKGKGQTQA